MSDCLNVATVSGVRQYRLCMHRTSNPLYTFEELTYQLRLVQARMLIIHPSVLPVALKGAQAVGIPPDRIVLFEPEVGFTTYQNIQDLVTFGLEEAQQYTPLRLGPGEAKTKLALLLLSSGTTGNPKVSVLLYEYHQVFGCVWLTLKLRVV